MTVSNALTPIQSEIIIHAPATKIFAALTEPDQLPQWWGDAETYHVESMERDLRVGGVWRTTGSGADGTRFSVHGKYRAIDAPRLLEYSWNYDWEPDAAETVVRFDLIERGDGTLVRVTHSAFVDPAARTQHEEGWKHVLAWLARYCT
jgi:uncharacterized protein YndB with AHSA1/START domain